MFKEQDNFTKIVPSDILVLLKNSFMEKNYLFIRNSDNDF